MAGPFAVIFDMDGVIIDSNPYHKIALRLFCEKYGYHLDEGTLFKKIYGRTNKDWIANLFERKMDPQELAALGEEKEKLFREIYKDDIVPLPGLTDFLESLRKHDVPRAIATSAPRSNVDFVLEKTGIAKYFDIILDESNVSRGKPDPEIYLKTVARLQLPAARCIVFEDSLSGITSAKAAGTLVAGVTTSHSREELAHTDFVIDDFRNLDADSLMKKIGI